MGSTEAKALELLAHAIVRTFESPNESDSNVEAANVVDAIKHHARSTAKLATAVDALANVLSNMPEEVRNTLTAIRQMVGE